MHSRQAQVTDALSDYTNIRTIPAVLSVAFIVASLYQFQGISQVMLPWLDYTLTSTHSTLVSLSSFAVAFASSETRQNEWQIIYEKNVLNENSPSSRNTALVFPVPFAELQHGFK